MGTLDEPDLLPPDIHIFTASKQPWVVLPGRAGSAGVLPAFAFLARVQPAAPRRIAGEARGGERGMKARDIVGLVLVCSAAFAAALGYRILGTAWHIGFALLGALGLYLLWSAARARRLQLWHADYTATPGPLDLGDGMPDSDD